MGVFDKFLDIMKLSDEDDYEDDFFDDEVDEYPEKTSKNPFKKEKEEYDDFDNDSLPSIMAEYDFSGWNTNRFSYNDFFCLNPIIVRRIGLTFDLKTMTYYYNNEKVSELFYKWIRSFSST